MLTINHNPVVQKMLEVRRQERNNLLQYAQLSLEFDVRVCAAWLFGSLGRGDADALSDIDLYTVIRDADLAAVIRQRSEMVAQIGKPVLLWDVPSNYPPGGAYLMALYEGQWGPHQVDWYWQAQSRASVPNDTQILFERTKLPHQNQPTLFTQQPTPERPILEVISQEVNGFWAMLLITAKYAARSPQAERMQHLHHLTNRLGEIEQFLGQKQTPALLQEKPHAQPMQKIDILYGLFAQMELLMPALQSRGCNVSSAIIPQAKRYLEMIEQMIL